MKKKPELEAVISNIDKYSDRDIDALEGSHFPQWIKDQLKELTKRGGKTTDEVAAEIAEKMIKASGEQEIYYKVEDLPVMEIEEYDSSPKERRMTSKDFTSSEDGRVGVILDSSTHGKHEDKGFEEHMRKVRERMRGIK